jgi:TonB family protein
MLFRFLTLSLGLHLLFVGMLLLCPVGIQVGAIRGQGVIVEVVSRSATDPPAQTVRPKLSDSAQIPATKTDALAGAQPVSSTPSPIRQTLLTDKEPQGPGFDLRNLKSDLSPEMQKYFQTLRAAIEQHKSYPSLAKRFKQMGQVAVRFEILKSGEILNVQLANPSAHASLNESALSAVKKMASQKFPLPEGVDAQGIAVILPINFRL